ncbi:uncharacterized protein PFL1_01350 [Pseudozyma flocculosa PF-1]|uniref:Related to Asparaginyl-tRNA synthetase n=1 Tax=Pseudozyma flocculosa TaxID=84751 RepID=A0A5C3EX38_9BASI|nr:uncharacterized protein PFL1_01350 [Pseudozyma flocculosa PF-1]EPQ31162.1 hypothetical protein PFL1_01350 [Pseudozyma flocculosa PF-1]SPO36345.1 related to Asparaginyl-tRNA synthetase [Pseudozyma flocculosa]
MLSRSSAAASRAAASSRAVALSAGASRAGHAQRIVPACPSCSRTLSSTRPAPLPRQVSRQLLAGGSAASRQKQLAQQERDEDEPEHFAPSSSRPASAVPGEETDIPWFMEEEQVDPAEYRTELEDVAATETSKTLEARQSEHFEFIPESAADDIPAAILNLQDHLLHGPASNLLARPPAADEDLPSPITFIHPYSLSADPSNDAYGRTDYVVIVQVKSSAAGSVRKVAQDVGNFLKRQPPPPVEPQTAVALDDLLGPDRGKERYQRTSESDTAADAAKTPATPRPKGMSRIEHELGKKLPDWAVHRIALSRKFPDGWKPPKILSREAQDGLRLLHRSDPDKFSIEELASRFRISTESVRRILRGGKWNVSNETRARQDQRAKERIANSIYGRPERWGREESELAEIRRLQEEGSELVQDGESPVIENDGEAEPDAGEMQAAGHDDAKRPSYPVRYEGLVVAAGDAAAAGMTAKGPSKSSHVSRGDGHWCLVDAEWCMVHVMTEQARFRYDIEGMWRELEADKDATSRLPAGHSLTSDAVTSTARSKKSIFGQNLNARRGSARSKANGGTGSSTFRTFSTSCRIRAKESSTVSTSTAGSRERLDLPESLDQLVTRCSRALLASSEPATAAGSSEGIPVVAQGWLRSARKQKSVTFLEVTDGTLVGSRALQAVIRHGKDKHVAEASSAHPDLSHLTTGAALRLEGLLKKGRGSKKGQEVELDVKSFEVLGSCDATYPLAIQQQQQQSGSGPKQQRAQPDDEDAESSAAGGAFQASQAERRSPHLRSRLPRHGAVLRTRQRLESGMADWFERHDFTKVTCPVLTSSDCEGAGEVFQVVAESDVRSLSSSSPSSSSPASAPSPAGLVSTSLQQRLSSFWSSAPAYLTVSSQLHLEAIGLGLSRVWTMNPAFRAEGSATNRHLAEFWMLEAELYWTTLGADEGNAAALGRLMDCCEGVIKAGIRRALEGSERAQEDMELLAPPAPPPSDGGGRAASEGHVEMLRRILLQPSWKRLSYTDAIELLRRHHHSQPGTGENGGVFAFEPRWGEGLASEHERYLASPLAFDGPVFVTDFPRSIKAFYMRANDDADAQPQQQQEEAARREGTVACFDLLIPKVGELVGGSLREERREVLESRAAGGDVSALRWYTDDLRRYGGAPHGGFGLGMERLVAWVSNTENVRDVNTFARTKGPVRF